MMRWEQKNRCSNETDKVGWKVLLKIGFAIFTLPFLILNSFNALATEPQPATLNELLALPSNQLGNCDIARMNLLCAEGLPGSESLNVNDGLTTLDMWAQHIQSETDRNLHHYFDNPTYYYNSTNFFKMLMMAVVLYEDCNIRYNPKWIESPNEVQADDHFAADSRNLLINGLIGPQRMGTCSSMPVLYVALARRLGYPVNLVTTKQHLFMRWDSPKERFDMDATGKGLDEYSDDFYKKFPFPITDQEIKGEGYLKSLSPREELSVFLSIRGQCLTEAGRLSEAAACFKAAYLFAPNWKGNQIMLADAQQHLTLPHYVPVYANMEREQPAPDVIPNMPSVDTGEPKLPDPPDPLKQLQLQQMQLQDSTMNPMLNP